MHADLPAIDELRDLLVVRPWRRAVSLAAPFALAGAFFLFAAREWWLAALACPVLLSFLTYGSISHDLVHRNLGLPKWLNETLLCAIELISFRSGHAYRYVHLNHHAHFPAPDDLEGSAAAMSPFRALVEGLTLQPRLWRFALTRGTRDHGWIKGEIAAVVLLLAACAAAAPLTWLPAAYALLMIAGSWIFPFVTAWVPHDPSGTTALTQTRLFRGRVLSLLALEHLYHLEHHLYPQVPHHNWPALARRLDPHFARHGIAPVKLLF